MQYITSLEQGLELFKTLGSEIRVEIIQLLLKYKIMKLNELASRLNITNGALTSHIKKLEECGLIEIISDTSGHGNQKCCRAVLQKIVIDIMSPMDDAQFYDETIGIGHYSDYQIEPSCGIATKDGMIGEFDNIRYFSHPDRMHANLLWIQNGYVEYLLPNFIPTAHKIDELNIQMEVAPIITNSDMAITSELKFSLNQADLGRITIGGTFGKGNAIYQTNWLDKNWRSFGALKEIKIKKEGTMIDGILVSDTTIDSLSLDYSSLLKFKISTVNDTISSHGFTLFGDNTGNYNQPIRVQIKHSPKDNS